MTKSYEEQINYIMDWFDFEKVHKTMKALDWHWHSTESVPEVGHLRKHARELLKQVARSNKEITVACGGFEAGRSKWGTLSLKFVVSDWYGED